MSFSLSHMMWYRRWLRWQGHEIEPIAVYEDNEAVVSLMSAARKVTQRTKHLGVRLFYSRELQERGIIMINWTSTELMIADLMTMPLTGAQFRKLAMLLGHDDLNVCYSIVFSTQVRGVFDCGIRGGMQQTGCSVHLTDCSFCYVCCA